MSVKAFETAAKQKSEDADEGAPFTIDGFEMRAFKPSEAQFAMVMASVGRGATDEDRVAGVINFVVNIVDRRGADHLQRRLLDRTDDFGIDEIEKIMKWLVEEWTGNPTQEPSGSTQSPSNDGPNSTPPSLLST